MGKASKRQKLTKEELQSENKRLRRQMAAGNATPEDQKRIVETLSKRNIAAYALVLFIPPLGIWYIWKNKEKLYLNDGSVYYWTMVGCVILFAYIYYLVTGTALMSNYFHPA